LFSFLRKIFKQNFIISANVSSGYTWAMAEKLDGMSHRLYIYKDVGESGFSTSGDTLAWSGVTLKIKL